MIEMPPSPAYLSDPCANEEDSVCLLDAAAAALPDIVGDAFTESSRNCPHRLISIICWEGDICQLGRGKLG
jgi:hypothetical protein